MPPDLALLSSTLTGSNYPCLELIFMVQKVFEPLKFDCIHIKGDRKRDWLIWFHFQGLRRGYKTWKELSLLLNFNQTCTIQYWNKTQKFGLIFMSWPHFQICRRFRYQKLVICTLGCQCMQSKYFQFKIMTLFCSEHYTPTAFVALLTDRNNWFFTKFNNYKTWYIDRRSSEEV